MSRLQNRNCIFVRVITIQVFRDFCLSNSSAVYYILVVVQPMIIIIVDIMQMYSIKNNTYSKTIQYNDNKHGRMFTGIYEQIIISD